MNLNVYPRIQQLYSQDLLKRNENYMSIKDMYKIFHNISKLGLTVHQWENV